MTPADRAPPAQAREEGADAKPAPYTVWSTEAPFRKDGFPVVGTFGATSRSVIIMTRETFKRLVDEHPSLSTAEFRVGTEE